jgi:hypothetical protein
VLFTSAPAVYIATPLSYGTTTISGKLFGSHKVNPALKVNIDLASLKDSQYVVLDDFSFPTGITPF